jgi:uncharacterized protein YneF (UPF0154 family)
MHINDLVTAEAFISDANETDLQRNPEIIDSMLICLLLCKGDTKSQQTVNRFLKDMATLRWNQD